MAAEAGFRMPVFMTDNLRFIRRSRFADSAGNGTVCRL
jgi:hypothetical protein